MAEKTLHMETTRIKAQKTIGEIQELLGAAGATQVLTLLKDGQITGLKWTMEIRSETVPFTMPLRIEPVFRHLQRKRSLRCRDRAAEDDLQQAVRVAWRQILRWLQAQLALIDTGMVEPDEPFMPYRQTGPDETLYQRLKASGFKALPAPKEPRRVVEMKGA